MENLKIRVNSESESKEVQELFFELGYEKGACSTGGYPALIIATPESRFQKTPHSSRATRLNHEAHSQFKEITLPELRDLVVLKRNDWNDRNVTDPEYNANLYLDSKGNLFVFHIPTQKWKESNLNGEEEVMARLKPIEKPMKEYLRKNSNGTYSYIGTVRPEHVSDSMIEIPEGATKLVSHDYVHLPIMFVKPCANGYSYCYPKENWSDNILSNIKGRDILWSRHTHPEELPFIDDEPLQSLNDQYAEIEKVRQTLNQRQSQYGSFEDVAMITEQMVDIMRKGYYENLAYNQKMALYMICSKMARIVNGNPNHKDSWHDIAGYAILIDNELESEKDMPF